MRTLHASGWWKATDLQVRTQRAAWVAAGHDFISDTEAAGHRAALVADGYTTFHPFGVDGQAECAAMVRDGIKASAKPVRLSRLGIPRRSGDQPFALDVDITEPLAHHRLIVHMPSGVEGLTGLRHNAQADVYADAIEGLKAHVALIDGACIITGDWNLNLRRRWVRKYLREQFPDFTPTPLPKRGGTHGRRFIDFSLARGLTITAARVVPNAASDHRALIERASIKEQPTVTDPYALTTHDGRRVDEITHQALLVAEKELGYPLTIAQGSYNTGKVSASAGTHDGGGVVDLAPWDHERKVRVLRSIGFAAWYRPAIEGLWGAHIHAVLIGNKKLAPSAARQVEAYLAGRNGLKDNGPDGGPREFTARRFTWPPPAPKPTRMQRTRAELEEFAKQAEANGHPRRAAAIRAGLKLLPKR